MDTVYDEMYYTVQCGGPSRVLQYCTVRCQVLPRSTSVAQSCGISPSVGLHFLPVQVWNLLVLWRMGRNHDSDGSSLFAGDKGGAHRGYVKAVGQIIARRRLGRFAEC